jgi:hypothetical protein
MNVKFIAQGNNVLPLTGFEPMRSAILRFTIFRKKFQTVNILNWSACLAAREELLPPASQRLRKSWKVTIYMTFNSVSVSM